MTADEYKEIVGYIQLARELCAKADHVKGWKSNGHWRCWLCEETGAPPLGAVGSV